MFYTVILPLLVLLIIGAILVNRKRPHRAQNQLSVVLPTLEQYAVKYTNCKTEHGMKCYKCGSGQLQNHGVSGEADSERIVSCVHCGTALYKL